MINNISQFGYDYICPLTFACNFAVIGTAIGVYLKAKDPKLKGFSLTGVNVDPVSRTLNKKVLKID